jgi:hypothetical protein
VVATAAVVALTTALWPPAILLPIVLAVALSLAQPLARGVGRLRSVWSATLLSTAASLVLLFPWPLSFLRAGDRLAALGFAFRLDYDFSSVLRFQRAVPDAKVVKSFNTVSCEVMVDASRGGDGDLFVSGNDAEAKATVSRFAREQVGWKSVVDLGDITTARGTEAYLLLWVRLWGALKSGDFNIKIVKK